MALQVVGVRLVADDGAQYIATLDKAEDAERRVAKGAKTAADGLTFMERAAKGAAERVGHLATDALADAGRAVLRFAADGIRAAGDFESGMNNFAAAAGGALEDSGQSLDQFKDLFISLGRDLPVSTAEVQQAAIEMAKGGIEPATIAAGGLERALKFAGANGLGLAEAAEIASKTIGGWTAVNATAAEKATFLAAATDLMTRAAGAASVNVDDLALGLYNAQGKAKSAGVSFAETVTTITALAPGFNSSAEAGNSFKNFLARLIPENDKAAQAMAELGLLTKDGTSAFYDSKGAFIGMEQAAGLLSKATKNLSAAERSHLLQLAFQQDAMGTAVRLAELGADGYADLAASIAKQNGVAAQAAQKQQGFNTAIDNLMGSLEALQITVFSKALPALTGLVNMIATGVNAITNYAAATIEGKTALADIAGIISDLALPVLYGLTAAVTAHALMTTTMSIPAIVAQTQAWIANTAAVALAALPYIAIGAAIAVTVLKFNEFNEQITSATDAVLAQKQFWTDAGLAIEDYGNQSEEAAAQLQPLADNIAGIRNTIHSELEALGKREAAYKLAVDYYNTFGVASGITADQLAELRGQLDADLQTINRHGEGLQVATKAYDDQRAAIEAQEQAILNAQAASITATSVTGDLADATADMGGQAMLTAEDIQKLNDKIADIAKKGGDALQSYASTYSNFFAGVEKRQADHAATIEELEAKKNKATTDEQKQAIDEQIKQANQSYKDQEAAAAESYIRQQEDQRKHLGQMLLDYTVVQGTLATTDEGRRARLEEVARGIEKEYGLQESSTASTFLAMTRSIDSFSKDSSEDINTLITKLHDQETAAKTTQTTEDKYYHDSAATAASTFAEKGGSVQGYIDILDDIPENKTTTIELPDYRERMEEIDAIDGGLRRIPKEVVVHVRVKDDVPPEYKPGSPTPFEMGIRGIKKALDDLAKGAVVLPGVAQNLGDMTGNIEKLLQRSDAPEEAEDLGGNILQGLIEGIADNLGEAIAAGRSAIHDVIDGMNDAAETASPSALTAETGANIGLGLIVGLEGMLPDVSMAISAIAATMQEGLYDADEEVRQATQDLIDTMVDTLAGLDDQVSDALAGAFSGIADIYRQQAGNLSDLFDMGLDPVILERYQTQLAQAEAEAGKIQDPQQAAAYLEARSRQIMEIAKLEQQVPRDAQKRGEATEAEHTRNEEKLADDRTKLIADNAANDRAANEDLAALRIKLAAATNDIERGYIAQEIRDREAQQMAERKRITEQLTLNEQAQQAERQRYQQELRDNQALADAEAARINQRIELLKKAHAAELAALQEERAQGGNIQELIDSIQAILDSIPSQDADNPNPIIAALYALLVRLGGIQGFAGGGRYPVNQPFMVGEDGPEILKMDRPGSVIPMSGMRSALQPAMGSSSSYHGGTINVGGITINGSGLGERALRGAIAGAINDVANASDLRIRMGVG